MTWYQQNRRNKYNASSAIHNGISYHSKAEAAYAAELDLRVKAKEIKSWRRQIRQSIDINGFHICNYIVDFEITHKNGDIELVEVKGFETEIYRLKRKLFEATILHSNPDLKYTVIKV